MDRAELVVVGGGRAGASAAIEAARAGAHTVLIDENPISLSMMGMDIPYLYGQRMMPTVSDRGLMLQRVVASNRLLNEAEEHGVDVQLGVSVWGSFRNQENSRQLDSPVLGLADAERSWMLEYDRLILAPGARDLALAFPGRELVGVMGANAVESLVSRYQSLTARRIVVLGSGDLGLSTAKLAMDNGMDVAAIVDVAPEVRGEDALRSEIEARGVPFYISHTVVQVKGHREVESIVITGVDEEHRPIGGAAREIDCDTVCLAIGLVPNVELPFVTGCDLSYRAEYGGWVPDTDDHMRSSIENVYVVGDGGGFTEAMVTNPDIAISQGVTAAAQALGLSSPGPVDVPADESQAQYVDSWLSSLIAAGGMEPTICQCEEVSRRDLIDTSPPGYLHWSSEPMDRRNMETMNAAGTVDLNQLKRVTRAGMGYCQGRRCREEVAMLVARSTGEDISRVPQPSYRAPVRPIPLKVMWPQDEPEQVRSDWVKWFRYPTEQMEQLHRGS